MSNNPDSGLKIGKMRDDIIAGGASFFFAEAGKHDSRDPKITKITKLIAAAARRRSR